MYARAVCSLLKLQRLHQGPRTVKEYFEDLETTLTKINIPNSDESKITMFVSGLRREIRDVVELYEYSSIKKLVHLAIKVESQILKKTTLKNTHNDASTNLQGRMQTTFIRKLLLPIFQKKSLHTKRFLKITFSPLQLSHQPKLPI